SDAPGARALLTELSRLQPARGEATRALAMIDASGPRGARARFRKSEQTVRFPGNIRVTTAKRARFDPRKSSGSVRPTPDVADRVRGVLLAKQVRDRRTWLWAEKFPEDVLEAKR